MDDVLYGEPKDEPKVEAKAEVAEQVQAETPEPAETPEAEASAPTAQTNTEKHVPLAALEAERQGRKDWKEKALRLEGEMKAWKEQQERSHAQQEPQEEVQLNPIQVMERRFEKLHLDTSERLARKEYGSEEVDRAFAVFGEAVKENPALHQQAMANPDPWDYVVKSARQIELQREIGSDPKSYEDKIRAKIMAEIQSSGGAAAASTAPAPVRLPQSLAGVRSSAARSAPAFTGPTPFDQVLPN